jgi:hypothetical protein
VCQVDEEGESHKEIEKVSDSTIPSGGQFHGNLTYNLQSSYSISLGICKIFIVLDCRDIKAKR